VALAEYDNDDGAWVTQHHDWRVEFDGVLMASSTGVDACVGDGASEWDVAVGAANAGATVDIHLCALRCVFCAL
jgi:hypothetical protein